MEQAHQQVHPGHAIDRQHVQAAAQMAIRGASVAAIHAISAKAGDPARPIQLAASQARHGLAFCGFVAIGVVIFSLPDDFGRRRPVTAQANT